MTSTKKKGKCMDKDKEKEDRKNLRQSTLVKTVEKMNQKKKVTFEEEKNERMGGAEEEAERGVEKGEE